MKNDLFIDNHSLLLLIHDQTTQTIQATIQYKVKSEKQDQEWGSFLEPITVPLGRNAHRQRIN